MGLGKTVMMLANIVNGKPKPKSKVRATLIVASPALVTQWMSEIDKHCQTRSEHAQYGLGMVMQYRTGARVVANNTLDLLSQADIVLTTYHEVGKSYPKSVVPANLVTSAQKEAWWKNHYEQNRGVLHRVRWFRVVLDEAQAIKNHLGHQSMACRALDGKHHWVWPSKHPSER
jgi:SNF2 family DNA or RNA helicase